jgi:hypothetical protein
MKLNCDSFMVSILLYIEAVIVASEWSLINDLKTIR